VINCIAPLPQAKMKKLNYLNHPMVVTGSNIIYSEPNSGWLHANITLFLLISTRQSININCFKPVFGRQIHKINPEITLSILIRYFFCVVEALNKWIGNNDIEIYDAFFQSAIVENF